MSEGTPDHERVDDWVKLVKSVPAVLPGILPSFAPYMLVLIGFGAFVVWNGGIVLGTSVLHP